jgi:hypothetical protein
MKFGNESKAILDNGFEELTYVIKYKEDLIEIFE